MNWLLSKYPSLGRHLACCLIALSSCYASATYSEQELYVFYPDVREPYKSIFNEIVSGIESVKSNKVTVHAIDNSETLSNFQSLFQEASPGSTIALGSLGKAIYPSVSKPDAIISGATLITTDDINSGITGISLTPSPEALFNKLGELAPEVKIISVVYHPNTNGWLIDLAEEYAYQKGLVLERYEAEDVREAASDFKSILETRQGKTHAIWLLQGDPTLDEKGLLPDLLAQAWKTGSVVFSSNPSHVKRGALFSLFPDNFAMGKSLALLADEISRGDKITAQPVSNLKTAVNIRTAEHLELNISRSQEREFDLIFPSQE